MNDPVDPPREQVEEIVAEILGAGDVSAALAAACDEHPAIAHRLRSNVGALGQFGLLGEPPATDRDAAPSLEGFELREVLGRGGMGVVYRAFDRALGREVALKVLRPELLHFDDSRQRFCREVEAIARLRHPGIVAIHHANVDAEVPYFTMEFVDGTALPAILDQLRGRPWTTLRGADLLDRDQVEGSSSSRATRATRCPETWIDACVETARMVAEALQHAHEGGVFHRDVKPSNVMIDRHGRARLLDFGLARLDDSRQLTRSGTMLGSLPYMPREVVEGTCREPASPQDVYSLGVTLYEMLTLQPAFYGATPEDTRRRIVAGDLVPPRQYNRLISRECETVCLKAMDLDPARRYPSARAFAEDLDALLTRRPIQGRAAGPLLRARRYAQRHPTATVGLALGVLLLLASLVAAGTAMRARDVERDSRADLIDAHLRFMFDFAQGLRAIPGNTEVRADLLGRAARELTRFESDPDLTPQRLAAIGNAHLALAGALGDWTQSNVGESEAAHQQVTHVLDDLVPRLATEDARLAAGLRARATLDLGRALLIAGERERAHELQRAAADGLEPYLVDDPRTESELTLERTYLTLREQSAAVVGSLGRDREALAAFEGVLTRYQLRAVQHPDDAEAQRKAARASSNVARALYKLGEPARAAAAYAPYVELLEARLAAAPGDARRQFERLRGAISYPEILIAAGDFAAAEAECRRLLTLCEQMIAADPDDRSLPDLQLHLRYGLGWALQEAAEAAIAAGAAADDAEVRANLEAALDAMVAARAQMAAMQAAGRLSRAIQQERVHSRIEALERALRQ